MLFPTWHTLIDPSAPLDRWRGACCCLGTAVLMYGSGAGGAAAFQTWFFDGAWNLWTPAHNPGSQPAQTACMAYDSVRDVVVLYVNQATWEFDGVDWIQIITATLPPFCQDTHRMAYDIKNEQMVMWDAKTPPGTWTYESGNWTLQAPITSPPDVDGCSIAYDPIRERVVMFGGTYTGGWLINTWEWDGVNWTEIVAAIITPRPRRGHQMTYDVDLGGVVIFAGDGFDPTFGHSVWFMGTWLWDGADWTEITTEKEIWQDGSTISTEAERKLARTDYLMASFNGKALVYGGWTAFDSLG